MHAIINESTTIESKEAAAKSGGQEAVQDDVSQKDVVKIAVGSKDHTTLVAALKQADYVMRFLMQDHLLYLHQPMMHLINYLLALLMD